VLGQERNEWLGNDEDIADWKPRVEPLTGWERWTYAVDFMGHCYFVDGDDEPNTELK
jgi:hypothetical protein